MVMRTKEPLTVQCCQKSWFERYEFELLAGGQAAEVPELADNGSNLEVRNAAIKKNLAFFTARTDENIYKLLKITNCEET